MQTLVGGQDIHEVPDHVEDNGGPPDGNINHNGLEEPLDLHGMLLNEPPVNPAVRKSVRNRKRNHKENLFNISILNYFANYFVICLSVLDC